MDVKLFCAMLIHNIGAPSVKQYDDVKSSIIIDMTKE